MTEHLSEQELEEVFRTPLYTWYWAWPSSLKRPPSTPELRSVTCGGARPTALN
jgi:hypothetical protein